MIDFHTHILPAMDDGAKNLDISLEMIRKSKEQGVNTIVLTPHLYRQRENVQHFLIRRNKCWNDLATYLNDLPDEELNSLPDLKLGAEVAYVPNISSWSELPQLCLGDSKYMLLELPFTKWNNSIIHQIYDIMDKTNIIPILAHIERYRKMQDKNLFEEVLSLGIPIQLGCDFISDFWERRAVFNLLKKNDNFILASDAHNLTSRPPNLGKAMDLIEKKYGVSFAQEVKQRAIDILKGI